jgi:hypothetical protein
MKNENKKPQLFGIIINIVILRSLYWGWNV